MERLRIVAIALLALTYLGAIALPCASPGPAPAPVAASDSGPVVSVFCPCHAGESAPNSVGSDWQGPRSVFLRADPFARADALPGFEPIAPLVSLPLPDAIPISALV